MWTYFLILLAVLAISVVYIRRAYLMIKKKNQPKEGKKPALNLEEEGLAEKVRVSKQDRAELEFLYQKGENFLAAGNDDEAIKCFVQVLAIDAMHIETQNKLALLYMQKQMFSAATALFKQLASLTADPVHFSHLGLALYSQNEYEQAKEAYQKAIELDPSRLQRFASLAQVYRALGQLQNSIIALNKALEADQKNTDFLLLLAEIQIDMQDFDQAKAVIKNILAIEPENPYAKNLLKEIKKLQTPVV